MVIGAGGYGHEVAGYASEIFLAQGDTDSSICFLDDWPDAASERAEWLLHTTGSFHHRENDTFVIAVGDVELRRSFASRYAEYNFTWSTLIHPTSHISPHANIGLGSIIGPFCTVSYGACVGSHVSLNSYCGIGHHAKVGDYSVVSPKVLVAGKAELKSSSFVGAGAVITPGKVVESGAKVGAGSVVYRNVASNHTVLGNPAKVISKK